MVAALKLLPTNNAPFEATTSSKASRHDLILEPGDPLVLKYTLQKRAADGTLSRWDVTPYTIVASAFNPTPPPAGTTMTFTNAKSSSLGDAIKDILTVTISAAQSTTIGQNDNYIWGIRFTETANTVNTFTFLSGNITAKEATLV